MKPAADSADEAATTDPPKRAAKADKETKQVGGEENWSLSENLTANFSSDLSPSVPPYTAL